MNDFINLSDDEHDVLSELEDLFDDLSIEGPSKDQLFIMYGLFLRDVVDNPVIIKGIPLSINRNKSNHPICKGKFQGFEHIITRESKYKGKRDFDRERANKVHWIRPIIENSGDARIKYFERINDEGFNQQFYYYEAKGFIVIVRELKPDLMLITSFSVDNYESSKYKRWYNEFRTR